MNLYKSDLKWFERNIEEFLLYHNNDSESHGKKGFGYVITKICLGDSCMLCNRNKVWGNRAKTSVTSMNG